MAAKTTDFPAKQKQLNDDIAKYLYKLKNLINKQNMKF